MTTLNNSSNGARATHGQNLPKTEGQLYLESIIAGQQKEHAQVLLQKQKLQQCPETVNESRIFISKYNEIDTSTKLINKSPYIPELVTDVIKVYSELLTRTFTADELLNHIGIDNNQYQLISYIAHEGKRAGLPDEAVNEYKYYIYLMKK